MRLPKRHFDCIFHAMTTTKPIVSRFAPSPTGGLHLGHAYSALFAERQALDAGGRFLLRIEDIDTGRCRSEFEESIYEDLAWLGLSWETPVRRQSMHMADYKAALDQLADQSLLYPCFCTRKDIACEIEAAQSAPHLVVNGPDGPLYPGTCRALTSAEQEAKIAAGTPYALRLNMTLAKEIAGTLFWNDEDKGAIKATPEIFGDVVLARKDTPTSYHLSVTVDDHVQGVTLVTRGEDLFSATHIHRLLQALLGLDVPLYRHHDMLTGPDGNRLAKRDKAQTLKNLRNSGKTPQDIRHAAGFINNIDAA